MAWRDTYKVHPAADVFPMMSDEELAALGQDILENGLREPIKLMRVGREKQIAENTFSQQEVLLDGRNRLAAMERVGIDLDSCAVKYQYVNGSRGPFDFDAVSYIISLNIHRRHITTKQRQAELIVEAHKAAAAKPVQPEPVCNKGGRGNKNPIKTAILADAKKRGISDSTVKRAIAKADGKVPKPKGVADDENENSSALEIARGAAKSAREAASVLREFEDTLEIDDDLLDACRKAAVAWSKLLARLKTNDNFEDDTFEPSVEEPAQVLTNVLDSIKDAKSVAEAYRKIFKVSSFDREAKKQIYDAINLLIAKWQRVQSTLSSRVS
jgi:hypothetical protein